MAIPQPSQYQVDNMEPGDMIFVSKQSWLYRLYRKFFLNKPKIKVRKYWSNNEINEYNIYYQEDCTLIYYYELTCVQTYKDEVDVIISTNDGKNKLMQKTLKSLQVGLYNAVLHFYSGLTITLPISYFEKAIESNKVKLKTINDRRVIADLIKFQKYKGDYFKDYVEKYNIKSWISAYCSVCGKPVIFKFEGDYIIIDNQCNCGELKLEKSKFDYDEFSIWYYNQTNPTVKKLYNEFWFRKDT